MWRFTHEIKDIQYNAKYHLPKMGKIETIVGVQGMHQTNANSGRIFDSGCVTNDFGVFGTANYEWKSNVLQAGLRFDNKCLLQRHKELQAKKVLLKRLINHNSFNASFRL
jgi:iron complex outermembrane receptor protein